MVCATRHGPPPRAGHPTRQVRDRWTALHMRDFAGCLDLGWQGSPRTHFGRSVSCSLSPARRLRHSRGPSLSFPLERSQSSVPRIPNGCIAVSPAESYSRHYPASRPSSFWASRRLCSGSRRLRGRIATFCGVAQVREPDSYSRERVMLPVRRYWLCLLPISISRTPSTSGMPTTQAKTINADLLGV